MTAPQKKIIDFPKLMDRLLRLLTEKEQNVVSRRFSLGGGKRETLDKIGKSYSITRERVRQIETMAIKKLARISMDPSMRFIHDLAYSILVKNGRVMAEDILISEMLKKVGDDDIDVNAMKLAMRISGRLVKQEKNQFHRPFWLTTNISVNEIKGTIRSVQKALQKKGLVLQTEEIKQLLNGEADIAIIASVLRIDRSFKN